MQGADKRSRRGLRHDLRPGGSFQKEKLKSEWRTKYMHAAPVTRLSPSFVLFQIRLNLVHGIRP
jgi:hypothetical protein